MKRKTILKWVAFILIAMIGEIFYLVLHEGGHALLAFLTLGKWFPIHIGIDCYVDIPIKNTTNIDFAFIAIGSFILPEISYLILCLFKNAYITMLRVFSSMGVHFNLIVSIIILIIGAEKYEEYDILLFQHYLSINTGIIIVPLMSVLILNIFVEIETRGFNCIIEELDK